MKTDQRLAAVCLALLTLALVSPAWGQQQIADPQAAATAPLDAEMPVDPAVRTGTLHPCQPSAGEPRRAAPGGQRRLGAGGR